MKEQIGGPLYVVTELHGQVSYPDAIFELEGSIRLSLTHAEKGGVDHICFKADLEFLLVRDQNNIVAGYGKAAAWVRAFRMFYPEFVV
ncbi:msr4212 [Mesorhizobium japonicum MAFF 303099]|nr:msr4212 [Mesorhizobium japonicum MAFF 303099]